MEEVLDSDKYRMRPLFDTVKHLRQNGPVTASELRSALIAAARTELAERGRAQLSLRAVARRAGVSHAAPAYHFTDRAGLLTAVVAEGFRELAADMDAPLEGEGVAAPLAQLGRRYVAFASREPALYELMFRPEELHSDDPELAAARAASLGRLASATGSGPDRIGDVTIISWAFAHGIATLAAQGALGVLRPGDDVATAAEQLVDVYAALVEQPAR